jgi:CRP-like cAMP-binding protein
MNESVYQALHQIDFFREYSREDVEELLRVGQWVKYNSGACIIQEGANDLDMYVLVRGQVKVIKNRKTLAVLNPGDSFGEISSLAATPRTAHVMAHGDVYCVRFEPRLLNRLPVDLQLKIVRRLLFTLAERLAVLNRKFAVT